MFTPFVFIHILHKNYKQESQKTYNCIPSRLELTNRTPVKNKEQADTHQNQPKNLDEKLHSRTGRMSGRPLEHQGTQSQRGQRKNEINNDNANIQPKQSCLLGMSLCLFVRLFYVNVCIYVI